MRKVYSIGLFVLIITNIYGLYGQQVLTLADALKLGLENNHQVKIANNEAVMANNNEAIGRGGFLPSVTANAAYTQVRNSTRQERSEGTITEKDDALSTNTSANMQVSWVLFDGLKMFYDNSRYNALGQMGELQLREKIENSLSQIIVAYFSVVQKQRGIEVALAALTNAQQRRELAAARLRLGSAAETELLQAQIDANADSAVWLNSHNELLNSKAELCLLLGLDVQTDLEATDTIESLMTFQFNDLLNTALDQNSGLQQWEVSEKVALLQQKMAVSPRYPKITLNGVYAYSLAEAEVGILRSNRNMGPSVGVALTYPLFDGFKNTTQLKNAKLRLENVQIAQAYAYEQVKSDLLKRYNSYLNYLQQLTVAKSNVQLADRNANLAWERYRLGQISDLDYRQMQYIKVDAANKFLLLQWQAKQYEVELLRISGRLMVQN